MAGSIRSLHVSLAAALLVVCASAGADTPGSVSYATTTDTAPSAIGMAADLIVARPLGLAATVLGTGVFIVALPFALISGNVRDPARRLIAEPAEFTFTRPLGADPN
jgi:hypothetical protein